MPELKYTGDEDFRRSLDAPVPEGTRLKPPFNWIPAFRGKPGGRFIGSVHDGAGIIVVETAGATRADADFQSKLIASALSLAHKVLKPTRKERPPLKARAKKKTPARTPPPVQDRVYAG